MFSVENGVVMLNGVPVSQLSDAQRQNAHGRTGDLGLGAQIYDFSTGAKPNQQFDPRYWETYDIHRGDSDTVTGYRLRPEYSRLQGMMQTGIPTSFGGQGEFIDPSAITYDEEFGYLSPITNYRQMESDWLQRNLPYLLAGGMLGAIGSVGGFSGLLGGAGSGTAAGASGFPAGAGIAGPSLETAGVATGALEGAGAGALGTIPESMLQNITIPPLDIANPTLASLNTPWYTQLLNNAQAGLTKPETWIRGAMGLASLANAAGGGGSGSVPGLMGGSGTGTAPPLNFTGLLNNYKPLQFQPVPFMGGYR